MMARLDTVQLRAPPRAAFHAHAGSHTVLAVHGMGLPKPSSIRLGEDQVHTNEDRHEHQHTDQSAAETHDVVLNLVLHPCLAYSAARELWVSPRRARAESATDVHEPQGTQTPNVRGSDLPGC